MTGLPITKTDRARALWGHLEEELRKHPGEPVLIEEFRDTPRLKSLLTIVNGNLNATLRAMPGRVQAHMRNSYVRTETGIRHGDLWVVWYPEETAP